MKTLGVIFYPDRKTRKIGIWNDIRRQEHNESSYIQVGQGITRNLFLHASGVHVYIACTYVSENPAKSNQLPCVYGRLEFTELVAGSVCFPHPSINNGTIESNCSFLCHHSTAAVIKHYTLHTKNLMITQAHLPTQLQRVKSGKCESIIVIIIP